MLQPLCWGIGNNACVFVCSDCKIPEASLFAALWLSSRLKDGSVNAVFYIYFTGFVVCFGVCSRLLMVFLLL